MIIEELFGTLQQSVVSSWRKHLRAAKYSKHIALDEFYTEMPELVDQLIEDWMGVNGRKIKEYTNIIQSKNMNTLAYLKELKRVVKQGYVLMNGEKELEADLDAIASLIDSTLYKVKELSENKTMNLKDFLIESLNISEAKNQMGFAWNHYDPSSLYCMVGDMKKAQKICDESDYNFEAADLRGPLCSIAWNDEYIMYNDLKGVNLNQVKKNILSDIQKQLDEQTEDIAEGYFHIECDLMSNDYDTNDVKPTAKDVLDHMLQLIEESEVDGDSSYGRAIIDIKNGEVLVGKSEKEVIFMSVNEFQEMIDNE